MPPRVTRTAYDQLTPQQQGYLSYMEGAKNPDIPRENPYLEQDRERYEGWAAGQHQAILHVIDSEA